jgi:hypothetical protein
VGSRIDNIAELGRSSAAPVHESVRTPRLPDQVSHWRAPVLRLKKQRAAVVGRGAGYNLIRESMILAQLTISMASFMW